MVSDGSLAATIYCFRTLASGRRNPSAALPHAAHPMEPPCRRTSRSTSTCTACTGTPRSYTHTHLGRRLPLLRPVPVQRYLVDPVTGKPFVVLLTGFALVGGTARQESGPPQRRRSAALQKLDVPYIVALPLVFQIRSRPRRSGSTAPWAFTRCRSRCPSSTRGDGAHRLCRQGRQGQASPVSPNFFLLYLNISSFLIPGAPVLKLIDS